MNQAKSQVVISPDRSRSIFTRIASKYNKAGAKNKIIAPSTLRIEQAIVNGKGVYEFPVLRDSNSDQVTEVKLTRNDKFEATHMGLFLMKRLSTKKGGEVLQTYPNSTVFADVSTTFLGADLECFYNGYLTITVGQTVYIDYFDARKFRHIEDMAQNSASTFSSAREYTGFVELTPQITLDGDVKNSLKLTAPVDATALVAHTTASTTNYLVLMLRGFLITNK